MAEEYYHFVEQSQGIDVKFRKDPADANKYLVFTCVKNENKYIREFIEHYLTLDFDKIILCDNNDVGDDSLSAELIGYINSGQVEIFDCRGFNSFQVQIYGMFAREGNYKWCAYYDCDEFLELGIYSSIKDFLEKIPEDHDAVAFNWMIFGAGENKFRRGYKVQSRFTEPVRPVIMNKENFFVKNIVRGGADRFSDCIFNGSHVPMHKSGTKKYNIGGTFVCDYPVHTHYPLRYKCGILKHYYTKSYTEWISKAQRGWPDGTASLNSANYLLTENNYKYPIQNYIDSFFIHRENIYLGEKLENILEEYDYIQVKCDSRQFYALTQQLISVMSHCTNHTFAITESGVDDTLFDIFVEYAMETGNRVIFAQNHDEVVTGFYKYSQKENYWVLSLN